MGKATGFIEIKRAKPQARPIPERIRDWREVYLPEPEQKMRDQGARCMDCGIPFCHQGCPLGNVIPDWNDLVYHQRWQAASDRLHATNNFPEWTGRLCPAPCEGVLCARHQRRSGHDQVDRAVDRRTCLRAWLDSGAAAGVAHGQARRRRRLGTGRARGRRRAEQGRAPRDRLRTRRPHRRAAPLRHSRVQARKALHRPPARPDVRGRRGVPDRSRDRHRSPRRPACGASSMRSCSAAGRRGRAIFRFPAASSRACTSRSSS